MSTKRSQPDAVRRILFRCDSGAETGFGHFSRCLNLARTLRGRSSASEVCFWGRYDDFSTGLLRHYGIERLTAPEQGCTAAELPATLAASEGFDALVLDSYGVEQAYLDALKGRRCRLAVLDDDQRHDLSGADLVICFRAGAEALKYGARREALGIGYLVVKPELREIREKNLAAPARAVRKVLVFLSGRDPGLRVLEGVLEAVSLPGLQVSYLARAAQPRVAARHLPLSPQVEAAYAQADFVVCGGGLVKYESAYCGLPNACLSLTALQDADTRVMAERQLTLDLGPLEAFEPARCARQVAAFLADPRAIGTQRDAFATKLTTDGSERVADLLLSL